MKVAEVARKEIGAGIRSMRAFMPGRIVVMICTHRVRGEVEHRSQQSAEDKNGDQQRGIYFTRRGHAPAIV